MERGAGKYSKEIQFVGSMLSYSNCTNAGTAPDYSVCSDKGFVKLVLGTPDDARALAPFTSAAVYAPFLRAPCGTPVGVNVVDSEPQPQSRKDLERSGRCWSSITS